MKEILVLAFFLSKPPILMVMTNVCMVKLFLSAQFPPGVRKVASPFFRPKRRKSDESELAELEQSPQFRRRLNPVKYCKFVENCLNVSACTHQ